MLEIEQKFAGVDFADLEQRLAAWGVTAFEEHAEADHYFNAPDRDFGRTGEAFRLRTSGAGSRLTYKGPRRPGDAKVRAEIEVGLAEEEGIAEEMENLLSHLGYRPVAVVRKKRRMYPFQRNGFGLIVCLDEVEEVGRFAEVEVLAPEEKLDKAREVMLETATALGLTNVEPRAYLTMLLASQVKH